MTLGFFLYKKLDIQDGVRNYCNDLTTQQMEEEDMIEIEVKELSKMYGGNTIFHNINFTVQTGQKIGLIGINGCGKTTLMKILSGEEISDAGDIFKKKGIKCGYLAQIPSYPETVTVIEVLMEAFGDIGQIKNKLTILEEEMALSPENMTVLLEHYGRYQEQFTALDGYAVDEKLNRIIIGMSFSETFLNRRFMSLSGGEKTKTMLGKMLLEAPDVMLLDEPTNHLDIKTLEWLEGYIKESESAMIMISHDRYFLDHTIEKIVELSKGETIEFKGNYSTYIEHKETEQILLEGQYKRQEKKIGEMESAAKRFRDWGTRADSEAMFKKAKAMEKRIEKMDKIDRPTTDKSIKLSFEMTDRSGRDVLQLKNARFGYDSILFTAKEFTLKFGERLVLLGDNGTGKTTLFKGIQNKLKTLSGELKVGSSVKIGALHQEILFDSEDKNILTYFREETLCSEGDSRQKLARYLFTGETVFKKVSSLSGGEKVRLKLALLMEEDINMLLLDEPTNHIDIASRETLEEALVQFDGTILFVSHDRFFIEKVATRVAEITGGQLIDYAGDYKYYKEEHEKESLQINQKLQKKRESDMPVKKGKVISTDRLKQNDIKKIEKQVATLENEIAEIEEEMMTLNIELGEQTKTYVELGELNEKLRSFQNKHDILTTQWLEVTEELDNLRSEG